MLFRHEACKTESESWETVAFFRLNMLNPFKSPDSDVGTGRSLNPRTMNGTRFGLKFTSVYHVLNILIMQLYTRGLAGVDPGNHARFFPGWISRDKLYGYVWWIGDNPQQKWLKLFKWHTLWATQRLNASTAHASLASSTSSAKRRVNSPGPRSVAARDTQRFWPWKTTSHRLPLQA